MSTQPNRTKTIQFSLVPEYSWWKSADGNRLFCVVGIRGGKIANHFGNKEVWIVEAGVMGKKVVDYKLFSQNVLEKKLYQVHYSDFSAIIWTRFFNRFHAKVF